MADFFFIVVITSFRRMLNPLNRAISRSVQVSGQSSAFLRISLGVLLSLWAVHYLISGRAELLCRPGQFHFSYPGFEWVQPWPGSGTVVQFWVLAACGMSLALGLGTRLSAVIAAAEFTHFFLIDRTSYQNHYYFMLLLLWWFALLPVNRCWSLDYADKGGSQQSRNTIPRLALTILQFHVSLPYIFGGLAKLESDWLTGTPMQLMLAHQTALPESSTLVSFGSLVLAWGGLLFDLCVVPGLLFRKTRIIAILLTVGFHLTNMALFPIHIFPWLMLAASTVFFPPDWPERCWNWFHRRFVVSSHQTQRSAEFEFPFVSHLQNPENAAEHNMVPPRMSVVDEDRKVAPFMPPVPVIAAWCLFQLLWPLRSHLYEGNANWTEQGHFFSWRMMLRAKSASTEFLMRNPEDGSTWRAEVRGLLNPEQIARYSLDPEMIRQLAKHLGHLHTRTTGIAPEVHVLALASLNGRPPKLLIDPAVDLAVSDDRLPRSWMLLTESRVAEPADILHWQNGTRPGLSAPH